MAISGTYTFSLNKQQIINRALQLINVYPINVSPNYDDYSFASDTLNMMLKAWEAEDIKLWKRRQGTLFLQNAQNNYQLGSVSGADHACLAANYVTSTVTTLSGTSLTVASATGFVNGMNIGIQLDNANIFWTTINGAPVGNVITLTAGPLTPSTTTTNVVVAYLSVNAINRPLEIERMTNIDLQNSDTESQMMKISYDQYFNMPNKNIAGNKPNNFYYDRVLNSTLPYTGTLYIFPTPNDVGVALNFTYLDSIQDMINNTDGQDLPQEWTYALVFNLAVELAYAYQKYNEIQILQPKADKLKAIVDNFDNDDETLIFSYDPTFRGLNDI